MQTVSQGWKDNQNELLVSESFVDVSLQLVDPDAYKDATATDDGHASISNTAQTVSEVEKNIEPYATLEKNLWVLDGTRKLIPTGTRGDCGYISADISQANYGFATPPVFIISFPQVQHNLIRGVTIEWGTAFGEYPTSFTVRAYNGNTVITSKTVNDNADVKSVVHLDMVDYDRIEIVISKWCLPYRRARIANVLPGVEITYSKKDIFSFAHKQNVDPISSSLPKAEISFSINNVDGAYNPNNLDSLAKYLMERQEIKAKYGYKVGNDVEWLKCGTFYISKWDAKQTGMTADFTARDLLEFLTDTYYKGLYNPSGTSLYDLAVDVLTDADLPLLNDGSVRWSVDESLKNIYTIAPLPIDTHANCLEMIANAGGCVLYQDREGTLLLKKRIDSVSDYNINLFNSYSKADLKLSKPLKQVDVSCYSYSVAEDITELYNGTVNISGATELTIRYSGASTDVTATVTGGTLNSAKYYTNACILNITANGNVTILVKGKSLNSSSVIVTTASGLTGETVSVNNTLITSHDRAIAIGSWVESYMKNRKVLTTNWRADPRLDALDVIHNENEYDTENMLMTRVEYSYKGAFRGKGEGRVI